MNDLVNVLRAFGDHEKSARPAIPMKGMLVAAFANGDMVELWFQSPTGDSSDSCQFAMKCNSPEQAEVIASFHRCKWGVPDWSEVHSG